MSNLTSEERTWGTVAHLAGFAGGIIPFGHIIAPLIIWQLKKSDSSFVDQNGKAALNFQLSFTLYFLIVCLLVLPLIFFGGVAEVPVILTIAGLGGLGIVQFIFIIMAAVKTAKGEAFHYPFAIKFVK